MQRSSGERRGPTLHLGELQMVLRGGRGLGTKQTCAEQSTNLRGEEMILEQIKEEAG